ncbi:GntR family transcriptional regulator [Victivallis sp. Marseille-Q1083]|uniref:GntR family transcriptional regulator n=1 Tax=Victivallis sp. Marseille-Q1083 TaxID=2717288 RepID=UPI0015895F53|nr:GntR family transcriptional regulator [Victivallis sp. Marseille-Q1083]
MAVNATIEEWGVDTKESGFVLAQELLLKKLLSGEVAAGQALKESVLAKEFGLNRPSVREALSQAVGWGVAEYVPYCGYRVKNFTLKDMLDWNELREGIEPIAARRLAEHRSDLVLERLERLVTLFGEAVMNKDRNQSIFADLNFHMEIINSCGNSRFASPNNLCYFTVLFRLTVKVCFELEFRLSQQKNNCRFPKLYSPEQFMTYNNEIALDNHRQILDCIRRRAVEEAEQVSRRHIRDQVKSAHELIELCGDAGLPLNSDFELICRRKQLFW